MFGDYEVSFDDLEREGRIARQQGYDAARKEVVAERAEHIEALRAAQQCIADFLGVYKNGGSMLIMDLAVNSLKNDALAKIDAVLQPHDGAEGE